MFTIEYSEQELVALTRIIDIGVKAGGLAVAGDAAVLHAKIVAVVQKAQAGSQPQEG